jgi:predicted phage tail protein
LRGYRIKVQQPNSGWTDQGETSSTGFIYPALVPGLYSFQVSSVNHADICSLPATVSITVPDPALIKPHRISGLELQDFGNNDVYQNSMPVLQWRLNSPINSYAFNSEEPYGANVGNYDPFFTNFEVIVSDANTDIVGWIDHTTDLQYAIPYETNAAAWGDGVARHRLKVTVQSLNVLGLDWPPSSIIVDNPVPPPPSALSALVAGGPAPQAVTLTWTNPVLGPTTLDFEQMYIYRGTTNSFPAAAKVDAVSGNSNTWHSQPLPSGTYWFFIAAVDAFFSLSTPLSASVTIP